MKHFENYKKKQLQKHNWGLGTEPNWQIQRQRQTQIHKYKTNTRRKDKHTWLTDNGKNLGKKNYNENTKDIEYLQLQLCFLFHDVVDITGVGALAALEISLKNDPYNQDNKPKIFTQPAQTHVLNPSKFETFLAFCIICHAFGGGLDLGGMGGVV